MALVAAKVIGPLPDEESVELLESVNCRSVLPPEPTYDSAPPLSTTLAAALLVLPSGLATPPLGSEVTASVPELMLTVPVYVLFALNVARPAPLLLTFR